MIEFDEIELRDEFIDIIRNGFAEIYDVIKTDVYVDSEETQSSSFPCCFVNIISPISNRKYDDDRGTYRMISFSLECDLYTKALDGYSLSDSVIKLSQALIKIVVSKYPNFIVTRATNVPFKTDTKRRIIDFACTYDVEKKIIYSN